MVKRLRRCPLTAKSAVRFRMGLPFPRQIVSGFYFLTNKACLNVVLTFAIKFKLPISCFCDDGTGQN